MERDKNHFTFPTTMDIRNYTKYKDADTIAMVISNKVFHYDTISIRIYYMSIDLSNEEYTVQAHIQKNTYVNHSYFIFLNKDITIPIERILSHEMIHLDQIEKGYLVQDGDGYSIYKKDTIYLLKTKYENRPYEIDAFKRENDVLKKVNNILYK
jgi:hypothetical protein